MTQKQRDEITQMSKEFADGFKPDIPKIAGSAWLIVDPLSGFLNAAGFENTLKELPAKGSRPMVLIMIFSDGSHFIPAGSDLKEVEGAKDWMWAVANEG